MAGKRKTTTTQVASSSKVTKTSETTKQTLIPRLALSGKLIKLKQRSYPNKDGGDWHFYEILLVLDEQTKQEVEAYANQHNLVADYKPWFTLEKEWQGKTQVTQMVQIDVSGDSASPESLDYIRHFVDNKAYVELDIYAKRSTFTSKTGEEKSKLQFYLVKDTLRVLGEAKRE